MVRVQTNTVTSAVADRTGRTAPRTSRERTRTRKKGSPLGDSTVADSPFRG
ncbi:hypothetical protein Ae356Ps1_1584c [Pseudonocardia sp. Ae356_Ps1]|nr:hypothetical protein Ae356Ps1_1584c [Pseudonocardia sp. Ae356_Ps1]